MQKRAYDRIPSSLLVKYVQDDSVCYGIAINISEKGMLIQSGNCIPCDSRIKLQIPLKKGQLEIAAKVMHVKQTNEFYDTMGVELLKPSKKYLKILNSFKTASETV